MTNYLAAPIDSTGLDRLPQDSRPESNLHILTCGPIPPSPPELLGSERFREPA